MSLLIEIVLTRSIALIKIKQNFNIKGTKSQVLQSLLFFFITFAFCVYHSQVLCSAMAPQGLQDLVIIPPSIETKMDYRHPPDNDESISAADSEEINENSSSPGLDMSSDASTGTRGPDDVFNNNLENDIICWSRWFFIMLLFSCTTILCGVTFSTMRKGETDAFEAYVCATRVCSSDT
jgi:hypothetical protein